jgi:hypothetical protein
VLPRIVVLVVNIPKGPASAIFLLWLANQAGIKSVHHYFTLKPSSRRHSLCASINFMQSGCSSPFITIHSSRGIFVSGQQQQMGFPDLRPTFFLGFSCKRRSKDRQRKCRCCEFSAWEFGSPGYASVSTYGRWCRLSLSHGLAFVPIQCGNVVW